MIPLKTAIPFVVLLLLAGACSPKTSAEMQAGSNMQQEKSGASSQRAATQRQEKVSINGPSEETLESTSGSQITR